MSDWVEKHCDDESVPEVSRITYNKCNYIAYVESLFSFSFFFEMLQIFKSDCFCGKASN